MTNVSIDNHIFELERLYKCNIEFKSSICIIKNLTGIMKNEHLRSKLTSEHWNTIVNVTKTVEKLISKSIFEGEELDFVAEFLRFLRNSCAGSPFNQCFILNSNEILSCAKKILTCFKERKLEKELIVLRCCLQLFGNLICSDSNAKSLVWNLFLDENIFKYLFENDDQAAKEYSMMVLYNCMTDEASKYLICTENGHLILTALVDSLCKDLVDWGILFLEFILKQEDFMTNCYEILPLQSRLLILDIIIEHLSSTPENSYFSLSYSTMNFIKDLYIQNVMNIAQICNTDTTDVKPVEIVKLLSLLCAASVSDSYSHILKSSRSLVKASLDTLKCVHLLGKRNNNAFTCISNLKGTNLVSKEDIERNPSYGFKKNLIRLVGNLSYNCKENQDLVRKVDGIPLLLDCCNLDARNPFIMQWCILAIRNILEMNKENQVVLASVCMTENVIDSSLIKELGFEIHVERGKCVLKAIKSPNFI